MKNPLEYMPRITKFRVGVLSTLCGISLCIYGGNNLGKASWAWSDYLVNRIDQISDLRSYSPPLEPQEDMNYLERGAVQGSIGLGLLAFGVVMGSGRQEAEYKRNRKKAGKSYYQGKPRGQKDDFDHSRKDFDSLFK